MDIQIYTSQQTCIHTYLHNYRCMYLVFVPAAPMFPAALMYVYMYIRMYVCMYACMPVCALYEVMSASMSVCTYAATVTIWLVVYENFTK